MQLVADLYVDPVACIARWFGCRELQRRPHRHPMTVWNISSVLQVIGQRCAPAMADQVNVRIATHPNEKLRHFQMRQ